MAVIIIIADENGNQLDEHDKALRLMDPPMKDIKQRTILTCFGEVNVKRRLYQDRDGNYHFLLKDVYKEQASMPAFYGQYVSRPWVQVLKELTYLITH